MAESRDPKTLESLVIREHPGARTTHEIAYQLSEILPIQSHEDFVRQARVAVGGKEIPAKYLGPLLPAELFPIEDEADLVRKVAAAVRVATDVLHHQPSQKLHETHHALLEELTTERVIGARNGIGIFKGPGLFEVTEEKES
jgi:hypothetical protein